MGVLSDSYACDYREDGFYERHVVSKNRHYPTTTSSLIIDQSLDNIRSNLGRLCKMLDKKVDGFIRRLSPQ